MNVSEDRGLYLGADAGHESYPAALAIFSKIA
jgi:hypothetical protein